MGSNKDEMMFLWFLCFYLGWLLTEVVGHASFVAGVRKWPTTTLNILRAVTGFHGSAWPFTGNMRWFTTGLVGLDWFDSGINRWYTNTAIWVHHLVNG